MPKARAIHTHGRTHTYPDTLLKEKKDVDARKVKINDAHALFFITLATHPNWHTPIPGTCADAQTQSKNNSL